MSGSEVAKQLALAWVIFMAAGLGLLAMPDDARYLKAIYLGGVAGALLCILVMAKPAEKWLRSTLIWLSVAMAVLGLASALGGSG